MVLAMTLLSKILYFREKTLLNDYQHKVELLSTSSNEVEDVTVINR